MKSSGATRGDYDPRGKYQEVVWAIFIINFTTLLFEWKDYN